MIAVGVRDLKNQLSRYLQLVKGGEKVYITEHNRIIAEISLPSQAAKSSDLETLLDELAVSGKLLRSQREKSVNYPTETSVKIDWVSHYKDNRE